MFFDHITFFVSLILYLFYIIMILCKECILLNHIILYRIIPCHSIFIYYVILFHIIFIMVYYHFLYYVFYVCFLLHHIIMIYHVYHRHVRYLQFQKMHKSMLFSGRKPTFSADVPNKWTHRKIMKHMFSEHCSIKTCTIWSLINHETC